MARYLKIDGKETHKEDPHRVVWLGACGHWTDDWNLVPEVLCPACRAPGFQTKRKDLPIKYALHQCYYCWQHVDDPHVAQDQMGDMYTYHKDCLPYKLIREGNLYTTDRKLILTVGFPRSGKTTWAKETGFPIVNPDSIRYALHGKRFLRQAEDMVWTIAKTMVRSLFYAGHKVVILDATNTTRKRRKEWESIEWDCVGHVIPTSKKECIQRARSEGDEYIIPVIENMEYEPITRDEDVWS